MKTFLILDRATGARTMPVEYRPLKVTVGGAEHTLALRPDEWNARLEAARKAYADVSPA